MILVVDDDEDIRFVLKHVLEQAGFQVATASNGEEALAFLETAMPDAILLDVRMPVMDGLEVAQALHEQGVLARLPVLIMTAYQELQQGFQELPIAGYIVKPFVYVDVVPYRVKEVLEQRKVEGE